MFRTLQAQIIIVLSCLILILVFQIFLSYSHQELLANSQKLTQDSASELELINKLERDVIDLQRHVLIYKNTETSSSADHFKKIIISINEKLNELSSFSDQDKDKDTLSYINIIERMKVHLNDYNSNFQSVIKGKEVRNTIFKKLIENSFKDTLSQKKISPISQSKIDNITTEQVDSLIKSSKVSLLQYSISPHYEHIEKFNTNISSALKITTQDPSLKETGKKIRSIKKDFYKLTQQTRGYVFLINVVMTGSANEILYLTQEISKIIDKKKTITDESIIKSAKKNQIQSNTVSLLSLSLITFCAIILIYRIIIPIRKITDIFTKLAKGETIEEIPGINRKDEVGNLAISANVFREKNTQTSELLEKTQKMNSRLEKLTTEAQQASLAKGDFLASMSHEIRTPMNGVMGMLGLLARTSLTEKQNNYTNMAKSSAEALLTVINDILDFSKIEAGKLDLEILDFNILNQLSEFVTINAYTAQEKNVELILDSNQIAITTVRGDPGRIRQILNNLVGNAIKFTNEGDIIIKASIIENRSDLTLTVSVIDSGIGIPEDKITSLFESFTQADTSTTREYGGTGLGLAITKQLCELMDGEISATSTFGKGSNFTFSIKLEKSNIPQSNIPKVSLVNAPILIVDDNAINREVLHGQLQLWGASVTEATCAHEAIDILTRDPSLFSIAIIDMHMPKINGAELGKLIRQNSENDHIHLIMMTSVSERGDAKHFSQLGFDAYFPKPATPKDLRDALMISLDNGSALQHAKPLVTQHYLKDLKKTETSQTRILLVDDNRVNLEVALGILEDAGYNADTANNGEEAITALRNAPSDAPYQIVLMDCQMPILDGYSASRKIRKGDIPGINKNIPIIAMTANAMQGDKEKCLEAGMDDYLSKPVAIDDLEEKIKYWQDKITNNQYIDTHSNDAHGCESKNDCNASVNSTDKYIWNKQDALQRFRKNEERLNKVIAIFKLESRKDVESIMSCNNPIDYLQLSNAIHSLKGAAGNISAHQLLDLCKKLEKFTHEKNQSEIKDTQQQLQQAYDTLLIELPAPSLIKKPSDN
ncbi:hypothetical protein A9Q81_14185 [Gammaproteobacteria bacterium 42_54_T18]|nr:hypothetical protein A9Q81_14185 [Gammaproteobacteria bacterium 42_54_T18]